MSGGRGRPKIQPPTEEYENFLRNALGFIRREGPCPASTVLDRVCGGDENRLIGWFGDNGYFVRKGWVRRLTVGDDIYLELTDQGDLMYRVVEVAPTAQNAANIIAEEEDAMAMVNRGAWLQRLGLRRLSQARKPAKDKTTSNTGQDS